jgi:hypothetical protein
VHELKRFVPRQFADWNGTYLIDSDSTEHWRDCRVIDISSAGAGLELLDASSEVSVGQRIFVAVHLQGEIRHSTVRREGVLRVGTQFINLTSAERTTWSPRNDSQSTGSSRDSPSPRPRSPQTGIASSGSSRSRHQWAGTTTRLPNLIRHRGVWFEGGLHLPQDSRHPQGATRASSQITPPLTPGGMGNH